MIKTRKIKVKSFGNEEIISAMTMTKNNNNKNNHANNHHN